MASKLILNGLWCSQNVFKASCSQETVTEWIKNALKHLSFVFKYLPTCVLGHCDLTSYISLYYHPSIGQTHVALCAEELEALLQIPLGVVINLRKWGKSKIRKDELETNWCNDSQFISKNCCTFCYKWTIWYRSLFLISISWNILAFLLSFT